VRQVVWCPAAGRLAASVVMLAAAAASDTAARDATFVGP
jgi:hypothetical protein